ncbi:hypothetical protein DFP83_101214 [Idiomarina fontislapidosi]|uniref:Uncharacterized protein n=1 Tax=Idiomarina fontislapidosi TaxID=263723 RepID=A0A432YB57_9GAMM|nr:hypothetical protein [Idiomarina fontislapidosi]PYE35332.1 hypothetical protein DFP83_101214 [Idiomarina fontislapidosi]RUO58220.1 hypothetical protein CWE25_01085 [Idiomarina fontislapidosi]|tara:strand:- start:1302 stop:2480 length:1179 start_codon:yes stop_codon:yes gene_type:complete
MKRIVAFIGVALGVTLIPHDSHRTAVQIRWAHALSNNADAQFEVAEAYWQQQHASAALYWWEKAAVGGSAAALAQLRARFPQHQKRWLEIAAEQGSPTAKQQLASLALNDATLSWADWQLRFSAHAMSDAAYALLSSNQPQRCDVTIPVIARSNSDKARYVTLLEAVSTMQPETPQYRLCFAWQTRAEQHCTVKDNQQAECKVSSDTTSPRIILAAAGRSYTRPHMMVLGRGATAEVIRHEWAHWLGFADEYAMRMPYAQNFCMGRYANDPVNVVVTHQKIVSTDALKALWQGLPWRAHVDDWRDLAQPLGDHRWQLGSADTQAVGLFATDTCAAVSGHYAWKPVAQETLMERHQSDVWPSVYRLLQQPQLLLDSQLGEHQNRTQERKEPHQ